MDERCLEVGNYLSKDRGQKKAPWDAWETANKQSNVTACGLFV